MLYNFALIFFHLTCVRYLNVYDYIVWKLIKNKVILSICNITQHTICSKYIPAIKHTKLKRIEYPLSLRYLHSQNPNCAQFKVNNLRKNFGFCLLCNILFGKKRKEVNCFAKRIIYYTKKTTEQ